MWNELKRKFFHLGALSYVVGVILIPRPLYLGLLMGLSVVVFVVEMLRRRPGPVRDFVLKWFGPLMRPREHDQLSGLFWMLIGMTLTVHLVRPVEVAATAMLYLILGDAMASLIGMRLGGPHWPGSGHRVSGSLACFVVCLMIGYILLGTKTGWSPIILGALTATVAELKLVPIDDNVAIPVASSVVLMLCYGLTPGF